MQFEMKRGLLAAQAADPDPVGAGAADVPVEALMRIPLTLRNSDEIPGRLVFSLEGTAAQTAVVEVWALDDTGLDRLASLPTLPTIAERATRVFAQATAAPITVTVDELTELAAADVMPGPGTIYVRVTTAPLAASTLKVAAAR